MKTIQTIENITGEFMLSAIHDITQSVQDKSDEAEVNCIDRSIAFVDRANQELLPIAQSDEVKISLGFVFEMVPTLSRSTVSFHASNYVVAQCMHSPKNTTVFSADAYHGTTKFIRSPLVLSKLLSVEDIDNSVIYQQIDYEEYNGVKVEVSPKPRPAPFKLKPFASRTIYLGETVGGEAISELADADDEDREIDKHKLPVLLLQKRP